MKKIIAIFLFLIVLFVGFVFVDRYNNVRVESNDNGTYSMTIHKGILVDIPKEQWINIDRNQFKPMHALLYVDNYNSILHKWENTYQSLISYSYKNEEKEFYKTLHIYETVKEYEIADIRHLIYEDTIENVQITFGSKTHTDYVLKLSKDDKIVNIEFYKDDIDELKPLLESIWNDIKQL